MRTEITKDLITAQIDGVDIPIENLAAALSEHPVNERPAVELRFAMYQREGMRHYKRLRPNAMDEVAASLRGTPVRYEHRPHAGREAGTFGNAADSHELQGAVLNAGVEDYKGFDNILGNLRIDGQRALDEMARGMVPRGSIEASGDAITAVCSKCETPWFNDRPKASNPIDCYGCGSSLNRIEGGERTYIDYEHATGNGFALLYDPASHNAEPAGMLDFGEMLAEDLGVEMALFGRKKKAQAEESETVEAVEVEAEEVEAAEPDITRTVEVKVDVDASELEALEARIGELTEKLSAFQEAEAELKAKAEAEAEQLNRAKIAEYMRAGYGIKDGDNTAEVRARDPEYFDSVVSCFRPNPNAGAGQRAEGASPPQDPLSPKDTETSIRARARDIAAERNISIGDATKIASREAGVVE
jgi:hypothetical protein